MLNGWLPGPSLSKMAGSALSSATGWCTDKTLGLAEYGAWAYDFFGLPGAPNALATVQSAREGVKLWRGQETLKDFAEHETRIIATRWLTDEFMDWGLPSWLAVPLVAILGPIMDMVINAVVNFSEGLIKKEFAPATHNPVEQPLADVNQTKNPQSALEQASKIHTSSVAIDNSAQMTSPVSTPATAPNITPVHTIV